MSSEHPLPVPEFSVRSKGLFVAFRLRPGQDLRAGIEAVVNDRRLRAAAVISCTGSLSRAVLRHAGASLGEEIAGAFEICSLAGTVGLDSRSHLHATISDEKGRVTGGHVLAGCVVRTTAEIVLVELSEAVFERKPDPDSGYNELLVSERR